MLNYFYFASVLGCEYITSLIGILIIAFLAEQEQQGHAFLSPSYKSQGLNHCLQDFPIHLEDGMEAFLNFFTRGESFVIFLAEGPKSVFGWS